MSKRIVIDPVTRIEGHAKISIFLDDTGNVSDAEFHVVEFRGFEKFCEGRPYQEMPGITARICGICPVSHLLASAKAGDAIMAVNIPPAAEKLRRMMNLGQFIESHALSFFHLSAPYFLWVGSAPPQRNLFGLIASNVEPAGAGIRLRQFGQEIIEILGGQKIDPSWGVPGAGRSPLTEEGGAASAPGRPRHTRRANSRWNDEGSDGTDNVLPDRCTEHHAAPQREWQSVYTPKSRSPGPASLFIRDQRTENHCQSAWSKTQGCNPRAI